MNKFDVFITVILVSLLMLSGSAYAQNEIIFRPLKYDRPHRNIDIRPVTDRERDHVTPWLVVGVNENVTTTITPGGGQRKNSLRFGEYFFVTAEEGRYLRIARDTRRSDFNLSGYAEDYGWVHKDDVLMWDQALIDPETNIALKGMILNTLRALDGTRTDYTSIKAYKDPELRIPADYEAKLFEIFYIYRYSQNGNAVLLGRRPFFSEMQLRGERTYGGLVGWVDLDRVLEWDHRVAVEPNYDDMAVKERFSSNIRATVLNQSLRGSEDLCALSFMQGKLDLDCEVVWDDDIFDERGNFERKPGYWRRFPVIGDYGREVYKLMVMGELRGQFGAIDQETDIRIRQRLNELIERIRNVNIVFVIDGTNSMGPYYQSVINSVERIVRIFEQTADASKELRFGYVVYRDYMERDRLTEQRQLTTNAGLIMNALRNVDARDYHDIHAHEAVYYGLRKAVSEIFTDTDETNILIHIGDAGNHYRDDPTQVSQQEIVDLLTEYKCYYIAYQAHHQSDHQAYRDFPRQIREIMSRASDQLYDEWLGILGEELIERRPTLQTEGNISRIKDGSPMLLMATDYGTEIDIEALTNEITLAITEIDYYTDRVVEHARDMLERGRGLQLISGETDSRYTSSFAPGVYNILVRMGIDENNLKHYYTENVQFVFEGYATRNHASLNRSLFSPVLLLDANEFIAILHKVNQLRRGTSTSGDRREMLYDTWVELLRRHIGIQPDGYYDEISLEEAAMMVFGVPMRSSMLRQIQLKDIHDPSVFSDVDMRRYILQISQKADQLDRIANMRDYPYSFISNDIKYYWINVNKLP